MPPRRNPPRSNAAANLHRPSEDKNPFKPQTVSVAANPPELRKVKKPSKPQTVSCAANIPDLSMQRNIPVVPVAPNILDLGDSFNNIVTYMRSQGQRNLILGARDYLVKTVSEVIYTLQRDLRELHTNRDSPALYPDYVLDHNKPMKIMVSVPPALIKFHDQFENYLLQMLGQCGFNATSTYLDWGYILLEIKFQLGFTKDNTQTIKNRIFEVGYQKELLAAVNNLKIDG